MKTTITVFLLLLAVTSNVCFASAYTGNILKRDLDAWTRGTDPLNHATTQSDLFNSGVGYGYVTGMADALNKVVVCFSDDVTRGQTVAVVAKYLRENPEKLDRPANDLVLFAFMHAFPTCPADQKK